MTKIIFKLTLVLILSFTLVISQSKSQTLSSPSHQFDQLIQSLTEQNLSSSPFPQLLQVTSEKFLGKAYQAALLDQTPEERLVVNFEKFDCILLVETVLALARNFSQSHPNYYNFTTELTNLRYHQGRIEGYCSRLHYFSDWLQDNQTKEILINITQELGGIAQSKQLNFMTSHRQLYPQLNSNQTNYQCIQSRESQLAKLPIYYIAKEQIRDIYPQLQPGDIIGVATTIPGLDVTHSGLIYLNATRGTGLIHASPVGQVVIAPDLSDYVAKVEQAIGIIVARPLDPRLIQQSLKMD